jgi:hypothetical protein
MNVRVRTNSCTLALHVSRLTCGILSLPIVQETFVRYDPVCDARTKLLGHPFVTSKNRRVGIELVSCPLRAGKRSRKVSTTHEACRLLEQLIDVRPDVGWVHDG